MEQERRHAVNMPKTTDKHHPPTTHWLRRGRTFLLSTQAPPDPRSRAQRIPPQSPSSICSPSASVCSASTLEKKWKSGIESDSRRQAAQLCPGLLLWSLGRGHWAPHKSCVSVDAEMSLCACVCVLTGASPAKKIHFGCQLLQIKSVHVKYF